MTTDVRQAMVAAIAASFDDAVADLAQLVRVASDNPPGDCAEHARCAADILGRLGFQVERHDVPAALVRAQGMQSVTNLIVRHRFGDGPVSALNAHGDVVPPGTGWDTDPYGAEIIDGWMHGRGVATSKSDIVTYARALAALRDRAVDLKGSVEIHVTYDEETGGYIGPKLLLDEGLSRPDFAICAGFSYAVVTAHNGCLHLEVELTGRSAHAARPDTGVDALQAATAILAGLYEHRETLAGTRSSVQGIESPTLVIGTIAGGINTNVVPDRVTFRLDRRIIPEENAAAAEASLRELIGQVAATQPGIGCEVRRVLLAEPLTPLPRQEILVETLCRNASERFNTQVEATGVPLYTDARHYCAAGIPTVLYGAGPRTITEANAHRANERLRLTDLEGATQVVALSLCDLLS